MRVYSEQGKNFLHSSQYPDGSGTNTALYSMITSNTPLEAKHHNIEAVHSSTFSTEFKNSWRCISIFLYVLLAWSLGIDFRIKTDME